MSLDMSLNEIRCDGDSADVKGERWARGAKGRRFELPDTSPALGFVAKKKVDVRPTKQLFAVGYAVYHHSPGEGMMTQ